MPVASSLIIDRLKSSQKSKAHDTMSFADWLDLAGKDPGAYAIAATRLLTAIGKPTFIDTAKDERLGRIFLNQNIRTFPKAFSDFYGMEGQIGRIVSFLEHAAQGLEESKQILYLLGPVGSAKSSLAERIKELIEEQPIYVLAIERNGKMEYSPIFESPMNLFDPRSETAKILEDELGIPTRLMPGVMSPWAQKRLDEADGDYGAFKVVRMYPSRQRQIGIAKTEPGDENNQDISALVGKVDLRKLDRHQQNDPDAYSFSGALNRANQGVMEFVEMFKAPIKMLHPLLTATQEKNYIGTENIGAIPFNGLILAHSNESEWQSFKSDKKNEAFIDRVNVIKVPYNLRRDEEIAIYRKLIGNSELKNAPVAPGTFEMLASFSVMSRLEPPGNSDIHAKMRAYNGENLRETVTNPITVTAYRDAATQDEGMKGNSTRSAFKTLSATFNHEAAREGGEIAADPIHLMYVLEQIIKREYAPAEQKILLDLIKTQLAPRYKEFIGKQIQGAYLESYSDYGQNMFDRYIKLADAWLEDQDFKDPDTGQLMNKEVINQELTKIEKPSGISNPKDFRNEVVKYAMRYQANNGGKNPPWDAYEKLRAVLEKKMFSTIEDILPVISFGQKKDSELAKKHADFVERMVAAGYTPTQVRRTVDWYQRTMSHS